MSENEEVKMSLPEGTEPEQVEQKEESVQQSPQFTEIEQEAMNHGWRPESEFNSASGKKWRTAEQFMELQPLYEKIDSQHKEVKNLRKGMEAFGAHYKKVEQAAYQRALAELKQGRKAALEEGDLVKAEEIRDQIDEMKTVQAAPVIEPQSTAPEPAEYTAWKEKNQWYQKDEDLTAYADGIGNSLVSQGKTPSEVLVIVEKRVRQVFPDKFRNPNKDGAPRVETGTKKSNSVAYQMSAEETRIMKNLIASGAPISEADYIRDLKKAKGE